MPETLNLFYCEPDPDRWLPFDRYPRRIIRRAIRGRPRPSGQRMVFLNLARGLRKLGIPFRVNDFRYAHRHSEELACIIGKPQLLLEREWRNPVLFGASVFSHPVDCPDLFDRYPVRRMLVPGEWMRKMCEPFFGAKVTAWPVGIDTEEWRPHTQAKTVDVLIYNKVLWKREVQEEALLRPIREALRDHGRTFEEICYGGYQPGDLKESLARCRAAVFVCEHETQGLAYQQILSAGVPVLAWDRGGYWEDPEYYPERVRFAPVTSVPYWDERCGMVFASASEFRQAFNHFWEGVQAQSFAPRDYILDTLTLEKCAREYLGIARSVGA